MEERRRFVRCDTRQEAAYTVLPAGASRATLTKDVSGGGFCLITDKPLVPGTQLQIAVKLPGREQPVNAIAEVVWSESSEVTGKAGPQRSVQTGVRCAEIAPADRDALLECVAKSLEFL
jgi:c-di-GMP-binding flagellar brake protein YcgR